MTEILTSIHGIELGIGSNKELIMTHNGLQQVVARPASVSGVVGNSALSGETIQYATVTNDTLVIKLVNTPLPLVDEAGVVAYGNIKIADLPAGLFDYRAVVNLVVTKSSSGVNDDWDGDFSVGTAAASNNNTLSSSEASVMGSTSTSQAVAGVTSFIGGSSNRAVATSLTAKSIYLNVLVDDTDHNVAATPCNLILNGYIYLQTSKFEADTAY